MNKGDCVFDKEGLVYGVVEYCEEKYTMVEAQNDFLPKTPVRVLCQNKNLIPMVSFTQISNVYQQSKNLINKRELYRIKLIISGNKS